MSPPACYGFACVGLVRGDLQAVLVPDEALGALELEALLTEGRGRQRRVRDWSRVAVGTGHEMGLEA